MITNFLIFIGKIILILFGVLVLVTLIYILLLVIICAYKALKNVTRKWVIYGKEKVLA